MEEEKIATNRIAKKKLVYYMRNTIFVTTSGMFWDPVLSFVSSVMGSDKVLFAVDYPFESNKKAVKFMDSASISDRDREKIYHLNAEKLLDL
jgi:2,3-dihydroxybenzoate decarboxylase